jgi:hypothetical protein
MTALLIPPQGSTLLRLIHHRVIDPADVRLSPRRPCSQGDRPVDVAGDLIDSSW